MQLEEPKNPHSQLVDSIKETEDELEAKLSSFGPSEFACFSGNLQNIKTLEDYLQWRESLLKQFEDYNPVYRPHYFHNDVENAIRKDFELPANQKSDLLDFFTRYIEISKERRDIVTKRLSSPANVRIFKVEYENFLKNISLLLYNCESAICSLRASDFVDLSSEELMVALKAEFGSGVREFPLKSFHTALKLFPLVRRKEIFETALGRLVSDIKESLSPMPQYPSTDDELAMELERLSGILGLQMDLVMHDGNLFFYSCDKLFVDEFRAPLNVPPMKEIELGDENVDLKKIVDVSVMKQVPKERLAESMLEQFSVLLNEEMSNILAIVLAKRIKDKKVTRERMTALLKLEFVRNKKLFAACMDRVKKIAEVRKKFKPEDESDYFVTTMSLVRGYALAALSRSFASISETVNKERVFEMFMEYMVEYFEAKLDVLKAYSTIILHAPGDDVVKSVLKTIDHFPAMLYSSFFGFQYPLRVAVDEMKAEANFVNTVLTMQTVHEMKWADAIPDSCVDFSLGSDRLLSDDDSSAAVSPFHVFRSFRLINKIINKVPEVAQEMAESFMMKWLKMESYVKLAIWNQLLCEIRGFRENPLYPYEYCALAMFNGITDEVRAFWTCPYLNDWTSVEELIQSVEESKRPRLILSVRRFIYLSTKLKRYLYVTQYLLPNYCQQRRMSPLNVEPMSDVLGFVSSLVTFSNTARIRDLALGGDYSMLKRLVCSQRRFNIMLSVATRFNNFYMDANFLSSNFGVTPEFVPYKAVTGADLEDNMKLKMFAVSLAISNIEDIDEPGLSKLFCNIRDVTDCTNVQKITDAVLPFAYRIELATLCRVEAQLFSEVSSNNEFVFDAGAELLTEERKIVPNVIPKTLTCLGLNRPCDDLDVVVRFVCARLKMLHLARLEATSMLKFSRAVEGVFAESMPWDTVFFSALNNAMMSDQGSTDMYLAASIYSETEEYLVNRIYKACLVVLDAIYNMEDAKQKKRFTDSGAETQLKRWWKNLNIGFWSPSKSLTSLRYCSPVYDYIMYQLDDLTRAEIKVALQNQDTYIQRVMTSLQTDDINQAKAKFMNSTLKCMILKYVFMIMRSGGDIQKLNVVSTVANITEQLCTDGYVDHQNQIYIQASQKLGRSSAVNVEMKHVSEMRIAYGEAFDKFLAKYQLEQSHEIFEQMVSEMNAARNAPNAMLKPECYERAGKLRRTRHDVYVPDPEDSHIQFQKELNYAVARLMYGLKEAMTGMKRTEGAELIYPKWRLEEACKALSPLIDWIGKQSCNNLFRTWASYIQNALSVLDQNIDNQVLLNLLSKVTKSYLDSQVDYELSVRMKQDFLRYNTFCYIKKVMSRTWELEQERMTEEIRKDFDKLLIDLQADIEDVKKEYQEAHKVWYQRALQGLEALLKEPDEINNIISRKQLKTNEERRERVEKQQEELRKRIRTMRVSRCLEGMGSNEYYTRQIDKVGEEKKSINGALWFGKREFEEEQKSIEDALEECFEKLTDRELEIGELSRQLEQEKLHTSQLLHWRGMSLKSYSLMAEQEKELEKAGDVNIAQLLTRLAAAHEELDQLTEETDEFDAEFTYQVREPMAERDRCYKRLVRLSSQNMAESARLQTLQAQLPKPDDTYERTLMSNETLKMQNDEFRRKIAEIEQITNEMKRRSAHVFDGLFEPPVPPLPLSRRSLASTSRVPQRIVKPSGTVTARSPGVRVRYRIGTAGVPESARR